jgi:uncharacterized protein with ATP-grasp and redox domains
VRTYLDCYPCFIRQALTASRMAGADEAQQRAVLLKTLDVLRESDPARTPPEISDPVHSLVREETGVADPYRAAKQSGTRHALDMYPRLKQIVAGSSDPLDTAIRLSIAGNIIDLGAQDSYDLWGTVERVLEQPFAIDDRAAFRAALGAADEVLYVADNAGETVFDRVLIEALDVPVIYAVRGGPIINDATYQDAVEAGIDGVATIVSSGLAMAGVVLERCSDEFRQLYDRAGLIIAKGQGNYETLSEVGGPLFFLLQVKCPVIGRDIGVPVGGIVLSQGRA